MPVNNELHGDLQDQGDSGPLAPGEETPPSTDAYANIYGWVWELLEETETSLPGSRLTRYVESSLRFLRNTWECLPAYADLADDDLSAMDEAVGHMVAARVRAKRPKKKTGELVQHKEGDTEKRYGGFAVPKQTLEEAWLEQAYAVLREVSCIAEVLTALRSVPLFQVAGKRREQQARGVYTRSLNPLFTILADEWDAERQEGYYAAVWLS